MSVRVEPAQSVPEATAKLARAALPKGDPYLKLRDQLELRFGDEDLADLFPDRGQPGLCPHQRAQVTALQFREILSDRQAVEAVRARTD